MNDSGCQVGARYVIRTQRWPDCAFEFSNTPLHGTNSGTQRRRVSMDTARVVDTVSCRQMYLRSYTFSREEEETFQDKTRKCLGRLRKSVAYRKLLVLRRAREVSHNILLSICTHLLACTTRSTDCR